MGGGWGCFVEYAGRQGIHVHAITISEVQHRFVAGADRGAGAPVQRRAGELPRVPPAQRFDAAVFMGTFEHNPEYDLAARFLRQALVPGGRVWADFCAQRADFTLGRFMKKYIWPGPITYVNPYRLVEALRARRLQRARACATTRGATSSRRATGATAWRRTARSWRSASARRPCAPSCSSCAARRCSWRRTGRRRITS